MISWHCCGGGWSLDILPVVDLFLVRIWFCGRRSAAVSLLWRLWLRALRDRRRLVFGLLRAGLFRWVPLAVLRFVPFAVLPLASSLVPVYCAVFGVPLLLAV